MKQLSVLLVEDHSVIARDVQKILQFVGYEVLGPFADAESAFDAFESQPCDILVFDVELKGGATGIDLAERILAKGRRPLVFITGLLQEDVRKRAIAIGAQAFINKPFNERNLVNAIDLAVKSLHTLEDTPTAQAVVPDSLFVKVNKRFVKVKLADIDFLEASGHYMVIYGKEQQFSSSLSLSEFLSKFPEYPLSPFVRVHRSYAVNIERVADFDDSHIYFKQKMVPVSASFRKEFRDRISLI